MKKGLLHALEFIIAEVLLYMFSLFLVYGTPWVNWGSEKGSTLVAAESLGLEGMKRGKDGLFQSTEKDPKLFVDVSEGTRYVQINLSAVEQNDTEEWTCYIPNEEGNYSELQAVHSALRDGNGIFYFNKPVKGKLRLDPGEDKGIRFYLNYVQFGDHAYLTLEWAIVAAVLEGLFIMGIVLYGLRKKVMAFYQNHMAVCNIGMIFFGVFLLWSLLLPWNGGADENMRYDIAQYIYRFHRLPRGDEALLCKTNVYGTSYAYSPYLSYLLGAVFMKIAGAFGGTYSVLSHSARLVSVLCMTVTAMVLYQIGKELKLKYAWVLPVIMCFWPQVAFLAAYVNNDSMAIMASAIVIYAWIIGSNSFWNWKSVVLLAIGMAFCVSSYYNAYIYLLMSFLLFVFDYIRKAVQEKKARPVLIMMGKGLVILLITGVTSGWWFVRNYIIYNGDLLGSKVEAAARLKYASKDPALAVHQHLNEKGVSLFTMLFRDGYEWVKWTKKSFVGGFLNMQLFLKDSYINTCLAILLVGVLAALIGAIVVRKTRLGLKLNVFLGATIVLAGGMAVFYSYFVDFQPQGRYVMPAMVPLMIWTSIGWHRIMGIARKKKLVAVSLGAVMAWINFVALFLCIVMNCYWD